MALIALRYDFFTRYFGNDRGAEFNQAREMLKLFLEKYNPKFLACDIRGLSGVDSPSAGKSTDFYLANGAANYNMKFATLDERIKHPAAFLLPD